ncbi:hypothetical protein BDZ89DRAFT_1072675 [Hymenopellis radicata]|nr:hypothetical protein BDZ89DRAFT_1072675 [Hymenopellis radicata]
MKTFDTIPTIIPLDDASSRHVQKSCREDYHLLAPPPSHVVTSEGLSISQFGALDFSYRVNDDHNQFCFRTRDNQPLVDKPAYQQYLSDSISSFASPTTRY